MFGSVRVWGFVDVQARVLRVSVCVYVCVYRGGIMHILVSDSTTNGWRVRGT